MTNLFKHRLPKAWAAFITPLLLSICMTFVVSAIATLRSVGFTNDFVGLWMSAWGMSWVVAFPALLLILPLVRQLVGLICKAS